MNMAFRVVTDNGWCYGKRAGFRNSSQHVAYGVFGSARCVYDTCSVLECLTRFSTRACFGRPAEFERRQIKNAEKFMMCFDAETLSVYAIKHAED